MNRIWILVPVLLACGCSEYAVHGKPGDPDEDVVTTGPDTDTDDAPPEGVPCDETYAASLEWRSTGAWFSDAQPTDGGGDPWYVAGFDDSEWAPVGVMPDGMYGVSDNDVFYRSTFTLGSVVGRTTVRFEGNDGVWLYVNGGFVGHWGSEWREGGCINDSTGECAINTVADPVDVTAWLQPGTNVFAVWLTNGPSTYLLYIEPTCVQ